MAAPSADKGTDGVLGQDPGGRLLVYELLTRLVCLQNVKCYRSKSHTLSFIGMKRTNGVSPEIFKNQGPYTEINKAKKVSDPGIQKLKSLQRAESHLHSDY